MLRTAPWSRRSSGGPAAGGHVASKDDLPLPPGEGWCGFQSDTPRVAVEGRRALFTPDGWVLGEARKVQLVAHCGGWLVVLYGRDEPGGEQTRAAWITRQDGHTIADVLGGTDA